MSGDSREDPRASRPKITNAAVLLVSAIVVLAGASIARRDPAPIEPANAKTSKPAARMPPPLPSGAPPRGLYELPSDNERSTGCHFEDRGFGDYESARRLPLGRALVAPGRGLDADGSFALLLHFHGGEPVRRMLAPEGFPLVIASVDAGVGSAAYERAMSEEGSFDKLVASVEREVAAVNTMAGARAKTIVLSSWSAGYGAVGQVLAKRRERVSAVVLLDSLYAGYLPGKRALEHGQLALYTDLAREAARGNFLLHLVFTDIQTPTYASTSEVASFLLRELGARPTELDAVFGEALYRSYDEGKLSIRGYRGADRDAHCAALHLLPKVLQKVVLPALGGR